VRGRPHPVQAWVEPPREAGLDHRQTSGVHCFSEPSPGAAWEGRRRPDVLNLRARCTVSFNMPGNSTFPAMARTSIRRPVAVD
jgi:hypothetical protein